MHAFRSMRGRMAGRTVTAALGIKSIISESQGLAENPGKHVGEASPQRNMFVSFGVGRNLLISVHRNNKGGRSWTLP
jgi:hypothetical protein